MYRIKDASANEKTEMILSLVMRTFDVSTDDETEQFLLKTISSIIKSVEIEQRPKKKLAPKKAKKKYETKNREFSPFEWRMGGGRMIDFHDSK